MNTSAYISARSGTGDAIEKEIEREREKRKKKNENGKGTRQDSKRKKF